MKRPEWEKWLFIFLLFAPLWYVVILVLVMRALS
jgi:hypothetical protein